MCTDALGSLYASTQAGGLTLRTYLKIPKNVVKSGR